MAETTLATLIPRLTDPEQQQLTALWPPDVFALTSHALRTTGAYRFATNHGDVPSWPPAEDWMRQVRHEAWMWWSVLLERPILLGRRSGDAAQATLSAGNLEEVETLDLALAALSKFRDTPLDVLTFIGSSSRDETIRSEVSTALLKLHALADEACAGLGAPNGPPQRAEANYLANCLLAETGSLSTLPRSHGLVLPKMRTADVGLTLRSFSHHLAYHRSEVEVVWRAMPWANIDENTLNILVLPWPFEVEATDFRPHPNLGRSRSVGSARFFEYRNRRELDSTIVLDHLERAREQVGRIHLLVLPEVAINDHELTALRNALVEHSERSTDIPMVITGVHTPATSTDCEQMVSGRNRVELSTYFGAKWYTLAQDKHHRWRMDDAQIRQYGLGGVLSGGQDWWEAIDIPNRKLSFLVPNGWLALTPLICEDLARMDPISEVVRGVGPTLVVALLFDGPQMRARWPARYASVLTDDPGSSVLSVTSLGMSKRSRLVGNTTTETQETLGKAIVALWNDEVRGFHEVDLGDDHDHDGYKAAVLTVSARWTEEFTADGRSDGSNAARFALEGVQPVLVPLRPGDSEHPRATSSTTGEPAVEFSAKRAIEPGLPESERSGGQDLLEVASFTYLVDSVLDAAAGDREAIFCTAVANFESGPAKTNSKKDSNTAPTGFDPIRRTLVRRSPLRADPHRGGMGFVHTREYRLAVALLERRLEEPEALTHAIANGGGLRSKPARRAQYAKLVAECKERLEYLVDGLSQGPPRQKAQLRPLGLEWARTAQDRSESCRVSLGVDEGLLWAIHHRIASMRRAGGMSSKWAVLMQRIEQLLALKPPEWLWRHGLTLGTGD